MQTKLPLLQVLNSQLPRRLDFTAVSHKFQLISGNTYLRALQHLARPLCSNVAAEQKGGLGAQ
jgi:hypothetical protein